MGHGIARKRATLAFLVTGSTVGGPVGLGVAVFRFFGGGMFLAIIGSKSSTKTPSSCAVPLGSPRLESSLIWLDPCRCCCKLNAEGTAMLHIEQKLGKFGSGSPDRATKSWKKQK
jgi:hypothetical protein